MKAAAAARAKIRTIYAALAGYINHPNVAGATVLSLGCQHAQIPILQEQLRLRNPNLQKPVYFFEQQKSLSEPALISDCIRKTFLGLVEATRCRALPRRSLR